MRVLQGYHVLPGEGIKQRLRTIYGSSTYFLKGTSLIKSFPPIKLSARKTFPVVAMATICECSLKGLNEMGSWISPEALRE